MNILYNKRITYISSFLIGMFLFFLCASHVDAAMILDISQDHANEISPIGLDPNGEFLENIAYAQTFTATHTKVDQVSIYKQSTIGTPPNIKISIKDGLPSGTELASAEYTYSQWNAFADGWVNIPLVATLVQGSTYSLVVDVVSYTNNSYYRINTDNPNNSYGGGVMYIRYGGPTFSIYQSDMTFRIYHADIVPGSPVSLGATAGDTQVSLSWGAPTSNGGTALSDYLVEYKLSSSGVWSTYSDGVSTGTSATVTGLTNGLSYDFRVSAINIIGTGATSTTTIATPVSPDSTAPVISSVSASATSTSVDISWTTDENSSSRVDYGLTSSYGTSTSETNTSPRVTSHTVTVGSLIECTTYHFRVRSIDGATNQGTGSDNTFITDGCESSATVVETEVEEVPTATGGTVELDDSGETITLVVPAGFSGTDINFQINKLNADELVTEIPPPSSKFLIGGHVYELNALSGVSTEVTTFDEDLTITLAYQNSDIVGKNEETLAIYYWNGSSWIQTDSCIVNQSGNTVSCRTNHFTVFSLLGENERHTTYGYVMPKTQTIPSVVVSTPLFTRYLKIGSSGNDVRLLQLKLKNLGYFTHPVATGYFGPITRDAVKKFQSANNIQSIGVVGPLTRALLNSLK